MDFPQSELPPAPSPDPSGSSGSSLRSKLAIVGASGLLFAGAVVGLTGLASAQSSEPAAATAEADTGDTGSNGAGRVEHGVDVEVYGDDDGFAFEVELSPEDEAVLISFEECLAENGVVEESLDEKAEAGELTEADWDAVDAAFETCEPILEDLSDDADALFEELDEHDFEDFELSPEDEAVFEAFEQCLTDGGIDEEAIEAGEEAGTLTEEDWEQLDSVFEGCESILDDLSEDADFFGDWEECEDEDYDDAEESDNVEESVNA